jgi:NAD(P)-dependent dehydrogenase (short-subunit alcohol dehydrogenase family)
MRSRIQEWSFGGRLAVVTGGGSGMGRELVGQLAAAGCSVATCDLDESAVVETVTLAEAKAPPRVSVTAHVCDVSDAGSVEVFRDEAVARHQTESIDLLFNNAGIGGAPSFVAGEREQWEKVFAVCWGGVYNCSRAFMPLLVKSDEAWLVNTSSVSGFWANAPGGAYCAAKFAVRGFTEALIEDFREYAPQVRVAVVMPGVVSTGMYANSLRHLGAEGAAPDWAGFLSRMGVEPADLSERELEQTAAVLNELFVATPSEAATIILDALRAGRWRILVGYDAHHLDETIRVDPEHAYEPGRVSLNDRDLVAAMLVVCRAEGPALADLSGEYELRLGMSRFTCEPADGRSKVRRGPALHPKATLETDARTLRSLVFGEMTMDEATGDGHLSVSGDAKAMHRFLCAVRGPALH